MSDLPSRLMPRFSTANHTIRRRLVLGTFLVLGTVAAFLFLYVPSQVSRQALLQMSSGAEAMGNLTAYSLVPGVLFSDREATSSVINGALQDANVRYVVVENAQGEILDASRLDRAIEAGYSETGTGRPEIDDDLLKTSRSIVHDGEVIGQLYVGHSLEGVRASVAESRRQIAIVIAGVFLVAFIGILAFASILTRPLALIMKAAEGIAGGDMTRRSGVRSTDEIGRFAIAFDNMVDRLEGAQTELRTLNRELEERVVMRTSELNEALTYMISAERDARESEERFRTIFHSSGVGIVLLDTEFRLQDANPTFVEMWKGAREKLMNVSGFDLFDSDERSEVVRQVREVLAGTRAQFEAEVRGRTCDGSEIWVHEVISPVRNASGKVVFVIAIVEDITERRSLTEQLQQAQKLEAVGRLAGGVAHDFNNLLTVINGTAELLLEDVEASGVRDDLVEIKKAGDRAAALTQQLLAFSRRQPRRLRILDINTTIREMSVLLKRLIGEHIRLDCDLSHSLPPVKADAGQIGQVIMNLAVNARDAMGAGGTLRIDTAADFLSAEEAASLEMSPGAVVRIFVRDTGCGMEEGVLEHIFEPFFTTKGVDKGTGLGLATVYGIVKQSGGGISVESAPGKGSVFSIVLPTVPTGEVVMGPAFKSPQVDGQESILVVEDEAAVRELTTRILNRRGYSAVGCATPSEALRRLTADPGQFDAIVSDIVMPEMSGTEMARRMNAICPGIPILFMSGYPRDDRESFGIDDSPVDFLQKPVSPQDLTQAVRLMLDRVNQPNDRGRGARFEAANQE